MKKYLQRMKTDEEVEKLLDGDLSDYLHKENFHRVTFEFVPQNQNQPISIQISNKLLEALKTACQKRGVSYEQYIQ